MNFFRDLGIAILDRWREVDFDGATFPDIAATALLERPPSASVDPIDVLRWVHEAPLLVAQSNIDSTFGQPPITVFWCERFYIDVLFWVDGTTAIHQHAFSGAFHVMAGSSIHSTYRFTRARRYCEQFLFGKVELLGCELLAKGDVRAIPAGPAFVHALFHLDRPSVSVVVRTPVDDCAGPQYEYTRTGFAFDPFAKFESTTRKIQVLDLLHEIGHRDFEPTARAAVCAADSFLAFKMLRHLMKRIKPQERYLAFLDSVQPAHEELVNAVKEDTIELSREEQLQSYRQRVKQSELRFFLALLLNIPTRSRIFELVRRAFPQQPPADTVTRWLVELAKTDEIQAWVAERSHAVDRDWSRVLDVSLDAPSLRILGLLLEGVPEESLFEQMMNAPEGDEMQPGDVTLRSIAIRQSRLLRPLLVP